MLDQGRYFGVCLLGTSAVLDQGRYFGVCL